MKCRQAWRNCTPRSPPKYLGSIYMTQSNLPGSKITALIKHGWYRMYVNGGNFAPLPKIFQLQHPVIFWPFISSFDAFRLSMPNFFSNHSPLVYTSFSFTVDLPSPGKASIFTLSSVRCRYAKLYLSSIARPGSGTTRWRQECNKPPVSMVSPGHVSTVSVSALR